MKCATLLYMFLTSFIHVVAHNAFRRSLLGAEAAPVCELCPPDFWCAASNKTSCPASTTSLAGSTTVENCTCIAGYYGLGGNDCLECPEGSWCPGGNVLRECPAFASSPVGSTTSENCTCVTKYHDHDGNKQCLQCPVLGLQYTELDLPLEQHTQVPTVDPAWGAACADSTLYASGGWCFSAEPDPSALYLDLDLLTNQDVGGVVTKGRGDAWQWVTAFSFLVRADGAAEWQHVVSNTIAPNAEGYTVFPGNTRWGEFPVETHFDTVYNVRYIRIIPMEKADSNAPYAGVRAGILLASMECQSCPDGLCCDGGTVAHEHSECLAGASNDSWVPCLRCSCLTSYYGERGRGCTLCEPDSWCPGDNITQTCVTGAASPAGSDELSDCYCVAGYHGTGGDDCTACAAGSWCPGNGSSYVCTPNSHSHALSTQPTNCTCNSGYHNNIDAELCHECPVFESGLKLLDPPDAQRTTTIAIGYGSDTTMLAAAQGHKGNWFPGIEGQYIEIDLLSKQGVAGVEIISPITEIRVKVREEIADEWTDLGTFSYDTNQLEHTIFFDTLHTARYVHVYIVKVYSIFWEFRMGVWINEGDRCEACSAGMCCDGAAHNHSVCVADESWNSWELCPTCVCASGYWGVDGHNCESCPEGYWCQNGIQTECSVCAAGLGVSKACSASVDTVCVSCPANSTLPDGGVHISECACDAGFYRNATSGECVLCEEGYWCFNAQRSLCPSAMSVGAIGLDGLSTCICAPGHVFDSETGVCVLCSSGDYCLNNQATTFPSDTIVNASEACLHNITDVQGIRSAEISVIAEASWISLGYDHIVSNAFEVELYPGQYMQEYVEVCSLQGCNVVHQCKDAGCTTVRQQGRKVFPFAVREIVAVKLFFAGLIGDVSGKVTVLSTALLHYDGSCACDNRELLCGAVCSAEEHLTRVSFATCTCVDGYVDLYPQALPGVQRCFTCPVGYYCQNGTMHSCPEQMETYEAGISDVAQCKCSAGFINTAEGCKPCAEGYYCQHGEQHVCPHGFSTVAVGSVSVSECIGLSIKVSVVYMEPFATLNVSWVPFLGDQVYVVGHKRAHAEMLSAFALEAFVPLVDGQLQINTGVQASDDIYTYCSKVTGECSEIEAPDKGDCEDGLYTNMRLNPWRDVPVITVIVTEDEIIPYCGPSDCFSSYHPAQQLLVYSSDQISTLNSTQIYSAVDGLHLKSIPVAGDFTLRWHIAADLGYYWPAWQFRVRTTGSILCADASSSIELKWSSAQESGDATGGTLLASSTGVWDIDQTFVSASNIFVYFVVHFSGQCSATVHVASMAVSMREEFIACVALGDHQTSMPGVYHHTPAVHSARVIIGDVDVKTQGMHETVCRECPKSFYCEGGEHIEHCPANSDTTDVGSTSSEDCLCAAGFADGGGNATCSACAMNEFKASDLSDDTCVACQENEVTLATGTADEQGCLCVAGYTAVFNATGCSACAQGLFKDFIGNEECEVCPDFSSTLHTGSLSADDCLCQPGYTLLDGACSPCPTGTFKSEYSNEECQLCAKHTYNPRTASVNASACSACPIGTLGDEQALVSREQCTECPADSYFSALNGTRVCVACPPYSTAPAGSLELSDCVCKAGFFFDGETCTPCNAGTHKPDIGNEACVACAAGTFEPRNGSTASACLQCAMGTYQPLSAAKSVSDCIFCPHGTYSMLVAATNISNCLSCPPHSTSELGSILESQCSCKAGYFPSNGTCTECAVGYYKDFVGDSVCIPCPNRASTTGLGSTSVAECLCDIGFFGTDLGCAPCAIGSFKDFISATVPCTECPVHQTTLQTQSTSLSQCVCDIGTVQTGYNDSTMVRECSSCTEDSYQTGVDVRDLAECQQCFAHALAGDYASSIDECLCGESFVQQPWYACECAPGFYLDGSECAACPIAFFSKENNTDAACSPCKDFSTTAETGADSPDLCYCLENFEEDLNGTCICVPGRELVADKCVECTLSMYKEPGMSECVACPEFSRTFVLGSISVENCSCLETFVGDSVSGCICDKGYYFTEGPARCEACPQDTYRDASGLETACTLCPENAVTLSTAAADVSECLCVPGYGFNAANGTCDACPAGTYSDTFSLDTCHACPDNTWSPSSASVCFCIPGYSAKTIANATVTEDEQAEMISSFDSAGTGMDSDQCVLCAARSYKDTFENLPCVPCLEHEDTLPGEIFNTRGHCKCMPGYFRNETSDTCTECPLDTFKETTENVASCTTCHDHSITADVASVTALQCFCAAGAESVNASHCALCAHGTYKASAGNTKCLSCPAYMNTGDIGSETLEECTCLPTFVGNVSTGCLCPSGNFVLASESRCSLCALGSYKDTMDASETCLQCPPNSTTLEEGGVSLPQDCLCEAGLIMNETSLECRTCEPGTYKPSHAGECEQCPEGTLSQPGATSVSHCMCTPGKQPVNTSSGDIECEPCPLNTYKATISNNACGECPANSQPLAGTGNTFCVPSAGYYLKEEVLPGRIEVVRTVTACEAGTYKDIVGDFVCTSCPTSKESDIGSDALSDCTCVAGMLANSAGVCEACPEGYYCPGQEQRIMCPVSATSNAGAVDVSDCVCGRGYNFTGATCVECPADWFKDTIANEDCIKCDEESTSFASFTSTCGNTGQQSRLDCRRPEDCTFGDGDSGLIQPPSQPSSASLPACLIQGQIVVVFWLFVFVAQCIYVQ